MCGIGAGLAFSRGPTSALHLLGVAAVRPAFVLVECETCVIEMIEPQTDSAEVIKDGSISDVISVSCLARSDCLEAL